MEGPYDALYRSRPSGLLWGEGPGRLVRRVGEWLAPPAKVLDAGCGDGKNFLHLTRLGFDVDAVDISAAAIEGLRTRCRRAGVRTDDRVLVADVTRLPASEGYDAVLSYGLYHCLPEPFRVLDHQCLLDRLRPGGVLLFASLTDELPMPEDHGTPTVVLPTHDEIDRVVKGLDVLLDIRDRLAEDHLPVIGPHEHSARWIAARKPTVT